MCARLFILIAALSIAGMTACSSDGERHRSFNPTAPTPVVGATDSTSSTTASPSFGTMLIAFPPRNEAFTFRNELELHYREQLRRQATTSYVDLEGDVVWTQEYLRYRLNRCTHEQAMQHVFDQIDGRPPAPVCGDPPANQVAFPPRNECLAFREQLELRYRDRLRRTLMETYVDIEGSVVWVQEYLRYRLNQCDHQTARARVFDQIGGRGAGPTCGPGGNRFGPP